MGYILAGMGLAILLLLGGLTYQTKELNSTRSDYAAFRATTQAFAEASVAAAAKLEKEHVAQAEIINKNWATDRADLVAYDAKLSALRSSTPIADKPTSETGSTETICYDWTEFDAAERDSEDEAARISKEGTASTTGLNAAITWSTPIWAGQEADEVAKENKDGKPSN